MSPQEVSADFVYFVRQRRAGSNLIKIAATGDCPYLRLDQLRRERRKVDPYSHFELLGVIEIPNSENQTCSQAKHQLQNQFKSLRDNGDWFRPGSELIKHIREHAGLHICNRLCPDGPATEEAMRALQDRVSDAIDELILKRTLL
jgi:hypothetical protein